MTTLAAIGGFLKSLIELFFYLKKAVDFYKQAEKEGWLEDGKSLTDKIKDAKSDDERRFLVRRLNDHAALRPGL